MYNRQIANGVAASYHRRLAVEARMQKPANGQKTASREFLYSFWQSDYSSKWYANSYRIIKKTAKGIYVERRSYDPQRHLPNGDPDWLDFDTRSVVVDRATLEREGKIWCAPLRERLYVSLDPPHHRQHDTPPCLIALSLMWPCTEADVKRAFRSLSKKAHPDAGGDVTRFIELQHTYEQALEYVQRVKG